jgi:hypothetical protein
MPIGKIVTSNSHVDYVCQVFGRTEIENPPAPADYAFGRFVRVALPAGDADLIGIIYNTILMNPEFGNLGPRLSSRADLEVFSPDYLNEQVTLVGVLVVGSMRRQGDVPAGQGIPPLAATVDAVVEALPDAEISRFHRGPAAPRLAYLPQLLSQTNPLIPHLVLTVLDQVRALFPEQGTELAVLRDNLAWRMQVEQAR